MDADGQGSAGVNVTVLPEVEKAPFAGNVDRKVIPPRLVGSTRALKFITMGLLTGTPTSPSAGVDESNRSVD